MPTMIELRESPSEDRIARRYSGRLVAGGMQLLAFVVTLIVARLLSPMTTVMALAAYGSLQRRCWQRWD